jgi:hypothetical protein
MGIHLCFLCLLSLPAAEAEELRSYLLLKKKAIRRIPRFDFAQGKLGRLPIRVIRVIRGEIIAAFPRTAFGKRDRHAKGPRSDRS